MVSTHKGVYRCVPSRTYLPEENGIEEQEKHWLKKTKKNEIERKREGHYSGVKWLQKGSTLAMWPPQSGLRICRREIISSSQKHCKKSMLFIKIKKYISITLGTIEAHNIHFLLSHLKHNNDKEAYKKYSIPVSQYLYSKLHL